jgi:uncharacterized SAM-binding protein YcdF (DUF218 family)
MTIRGVITGFVLSPVFLVLLALIGLLIARRFHRSGMLLSWCGVCGALILAVPLIGGTMLIALEQNLPVTPPDDAPPQAIVVLAADIMRDGAAREPPQPGLLSLERLRAAAAVFHRTGLPILISGGPLYEGDASLATVMAYTMVHDFQVPVRWEEDVSRDTWENAHMSATILRAQGISSIYLVTHAWHMRRAIRAFADTGITVTAAPTRLDYLPNSWAKALVPDSSAWRLSLYALHEWIGSLYYALR